MTPGGTENLLEGDPFAPELALGAPEPLLAFNRAGVLSAADVHVALTLVRLAGIEVGSDAGAQVALAAALAVRAPRLGHVFIDLGTAATTVAVEDGPATADAALQSLPWPPVDAWVASVSACVELVATGLEVAVAPGDVRPLRLIGSNLYLDRYWRQERGLARALAAHDAAPLLGVELAALAGGVELLFPDARDQDQRIAAASGALRGLTVIAGGPGTGKTTTVARLAALVLGAGHDRQAPLIALCAPTGKAAARLQEAIHEEAHRLPIDETARQALLELRASTIHRLLGWAGPGRFRHHAGNRLPHDVVIVDETSMVSLSLMADLVAAVRGDARLVLVGDPDQLSAIEAGAVLRDIVGPAADGPQFGEGMRAVLTRVTGADPGGAGPALTGTDPGGDRPAPPQDSKFGDGIAILRRGHRFGAAISALADAIRAGDADAALDVIKQGTEEVEWIALDPALDPSAPAIETAMAPLRGHVLEHYGAVVAAAQRGDAPAALTALGRFRVLCAHRQGARGVSGLTARIERWLGDAVDGFDPGGSEQAGRPLLVTANDYELRLFNGDTGVLVAGGDGLSAVFERDGGLIGFAPSRLADIEPLYATTVHKSQGSQFGITAVVLPEPDSRLLTRELLYTAITRARHRLLLLGDEESLRAGIARPVARATGLGEQLWQRRR